MEFLGIIAIIAFILLPLAAVFISQITESISRPRETKLKLEKEAKEKQIAKYKQLTDELEKKIQSIIPDYAIAKQELKNAATTEIREKFFSPAKALLDKEYDLDEMYLSVANGKLNAIFSPYGDKLKLSHYEISALIQDAGLYSTPSHTFYHTTLRSCDCEEFATTKKPCKHILYLAYTLGVLQTNQENCKKHCENACEKLISTVRERDLLLNQTEGLQTRISELQLQERDIKKESLRILAIFEESEKNLAELFDLYKHQVKNWSQEKSLDFPWLAGMLAEAEQRFDTIRLKTLSNRAYKSAELVKEMKHEKKELLLRAARAEALLATYENLFPWLEEFRSVPLDEALSLVADTDGDEDYDAQIKKWLSPEEYAKLPNAEKYQLALDRYQNRKKTDWEIGIEYERYIGYLYEQEGYTVKYFGATEGLQDMGRDLIATKRNCALIIQCKRWAESKTIHEKHIFQLYGTTFILQLKDPTHTYTPVFVTTTTLSDIAQECAERLHVEVRARRPYIDHPLVKCNIGKDEYGAPVRIYHLPFDQQYDRIVIEPEKGECYVKTVAEAEALGFRRAKRHVPD